MDELQLYDQILSLTPPWSATSVNLSEDRDCVNVVVEYDRAAAICCPHCGVEGTRYDSRTRKWRHLDTCQYQTHVVAEVPRVLCDVHGVSQINVGWAEERSRFTALFEAHVIDWLKESSINAVSRRLGISWNAIDGIMQRAVKRGLIRRKAADIKHLAVDEIAIKKGHHYVTVISNDQGIVMSVQDHRTIAALDQFYTDIKESKHNVKTISMDMSAAYISATKSNFSNWENIICFDRFHVMQDLNKAVNSVRTSEARTVDREFRLPLHRSRFSWLRANDNLNSDHKAQIEKLSVAAKKTARAWSIKQYASSLWQYKSKAWARRAWSQWYGWAIRSRLAPIKSAARSIKKNLWGIINAIVYGQSNARAEAINGKIKTLKHRSKGYTNMARFKSAILFNFGGLSLYP